MLPDLIYEHTKLMHTFKLSYCNPYIALPRSNNVVDVNDYCVKVLISDSNKIFEFMISSLSFAVVVFFKLFNQLIIIIIYILVIMFIKSQCRK